MTTNTHPASGGTHTHQPTTALARLAAGSLRADEVQELPPLVSAEIAAAALGVSLHAFYGMVRRGVAPLPAIRVGSRSVRFRSADLVQLLFGPSSP